MQPLQRLFSIVAPTWFLRRAQAISALRRWEAAEPTRLRSMKRARGSIDKDVSRAGRSLREHARWLEQNYDIADGALDVLVRNVVGAGIVPEPMVKNSQGRLHAEFNLELINWWAKWARAPEVTAELDLGSLQRLKARSLFRDGEIFCQYVSGDAPGLIHGSAVPFSLELIDPDQIPIDYSDSAKRITQGVGKNGWGRATTYYLIPGGSATARYIAVPAERIQHLKLTKRLRQTRGVSVFASTLERIEDTRDYDESERVAAKLAAKVTGYIKRGAPDLYNAPNPDEAATQREIDFEAGMWFDGLGPGEDIGLVDTKRPNANLGKYRDDMIRAMAAGIGCSFSSMSRNYEGSYSSRRQEASEHDPHYHMLWGYFVERGERPTWERLVQALILDGLVRVPADVDTSSLFDVDFSRPVQPQIDPQKETGANSASLNTFQDTLVDIWRRRGRRPADMWAKLADQAQQLQQIQGAAPQQAPIATPDTADDAAATEDTA